LAGTPSVTSLSESQPCFYIPGRTDSARIENQEMIKAGAMTARTARIFVVALLGTTALAMPAAAEQVARERDIIELRLGQRILVDDGSCPAGQIKEVAGSQLTADGVIRTRKCIPRLGSKKH
jgi:hypothetical protein